VILQHYFRKLFFLKNNLVNKFYDTKYLCSLHIIFYEVAIKTLAGVATGGGGGGGAGGSYELDNLMPPGVAKIGFFFLFWTFRVASH
jgi:hypothetical protein